MYFQRKSFQEMDKMHEICMLPYGCNLQIILAKMVSDSKRCCFTMKAVLMLIKKYVFKKNLIEKQNMNVIYCDKVLKKALGLGLVHTCQLIDIIRSKKTSVKEFRVRPAFQAILNSVSQSKRQKVFNIRDISHLFHIYIRKCLHEILSSDNPKLLMIEKDARLFACFQMKACHEKQLKPLVFHQLMPVNQRYAR